MRFTRPRATRDSEPNLIPLINVVFLLLIFFMLAGRLAPSERATPESPRSDSPRGTRPAALVILIDRTGQVSLNGEPVDELRLAARIAGGIGGRRRVQVKADARLDAMRLIGLLNRLRAAGAEELDLLTLPRGQ